MNVFFLAAGLGTRLRPLTNVYPKPCVPFLNVPMGLYAFRYLEQLNIDVCVANTFHLPKLVEKLYLNQPFYKNKFQFSEEQKNILGSAGGLRKAARFFSSDETILMLNADEVFFTSERMFLKKAYQQHIFNNNLATLVVMKHPEAGSKFGAIWTNGIKVRNIGKTNTDSDLQPWHYIGAIFLNKRIMSLIPENKESNIFYDVLVNELQNSSVEIFGIESDWYETGNAADYFAATQEALKNLNETTLGFIRNYDPSRIIKNDQGLSLVSNHISIDESKLIGFNCISKSVSQAQLKKMQKIENSVLFDNEVVNTEYFLK